MIILLILFNKENPNAEIKQWERRISHRCGDEKKTGISKRVPKRRS